MDAIAKASKGGTALPICLYADELLPSNIKSIGNDCVKASSLTDILRWLFGWCKTTTPPFSSPLAVTVGAGFVGSIARLPM